MERESLAVSKPTDAQCLQSPRAVDRTDRETDRQRESERSKDADDVIERACAQHRDSLTSVTGEVRGRGIRVTRLATSRSKRRRDRQSDRGSILLGVATHLSLSLTGTHTLAECQLLLLVSRPLSQTRVAQSCGRRQAERDRETEREMEEAARTRVREDE